MIDWTIRENIWDWELVRNDPTVKFHSILIQNPYSHQHSHTQY